VAFRLGRICDPVFRFEFVDDLGNNSACQRQGFGEFAGRNPRPFLDVAQHHPFGNRSAPRLQRSCKLARDVVGNGPVKLNYATPRIEPLHFQKSNDS
jgi:hypothetical protein